MGLAVAGADRHDTKLVRATVVPGPRPGPPSEESVLGSVPGQGLRLQVGQTLHESGFTAHIRPEAKTVKNGLYGSTGPAKPHLSVLGRGEEAQASAGFKARRWVVERTHSWTNRFRRILVRWDKAPDNYTPSLHFACALIALRTA